MTAQAFAIFETALGACALAWGEGGLIGVRFPDPDPAALQAAVRRAWSEAAPAEPSGVVAQTVLDIQAHCRGEPRDYAETQLDFGSASDFHRQVYAAARAIPCGQTLTYGEMAARIGAPGAARAVGEALGRNPLPIIVPCHRILAAGGGKGGFSAPGGVAAKMRLLQLEGALAVERLPLFAPQPSSASRK